VREVESYAMESTCKSMRGLIILYQRYIAWIRNREFIVSEYSKLPVRQKGCVKEAFFVKYFWIVACCAEGCVCVREWITEETSCAVCCVSCCSGSEGVAFVHRRSFQCFILSL